MNYTYSRTPLVRAVVAGLAAMGCVTGAIASVQAAQDVAAAADVADPDEVVAVKQLCDALQGAIRPLVDPGSVEDLEAAMIFAISQTDYGERVVELALDCLEMRYADDQKVRTAIANVRLALLRNASRGTAALGGGAGSAGGIGFGAPVIGVGGGGANYGQ